MSDGVARIARDTSGPPGVSDEERATADVGETVPDGAEDSAPGQGEDAEYDGELESAPPPLVADEDLPAALQAVLLVVDTPVTETALAAAVGRPAALVREHLVSLSEQLGSARWGIDLREAGGGWRFYTRAEFAPVVERFVLDGAQARLSRAALESLAVIAYRQPVTRARVAAVRGVNVDGVIRTLLARGLIEESGTDADTGGTLYRTTGLFLDRMGLAGIDELPPLGPLLPDVDAIDDV